MEEIIRDVVKGILSEYQSGDFCGCYEGDIYGCFPITIEALENKLVARIAQRLTSLALDTATPSDNKAALRK